MKCLETRTRGQLRYRRYRDPDGAIHHTVEVPREVWNYINKQGRANDRLAQHMNRRQRLAKRTEVERLLDEGWKPLAVAHEVGVSLRSVHRWRAGKC